jgi:type IV pilus assembly protein PilA
MLQRLRQRAKNEEGFTLIELLVVVLIIGILAAIAIPSFLNQRTKAQDATTKSDARTAQTAMETWYTNEQNYDATPAQLKTIEQSLNNATITSTNTPAGGFTVASSANGRTYTITRAANGTVTRTCAPAGEGACKSNGSW